MNFSSSFRNWQSEQPVSLAVYIPTWGRPNHALDQVARLHTQRTELGTPMQITIIISINGDDDYELSDLRAAGADTVIQLPTNVGADVNYCLGWLQSDSSDYLWILSDDDPLVEGALNKVSGLLERRPDMIVSTRKSTAWCMNSPQDLERLESRGAVLALYSATIFRRERFAKFVPHAFSTTFSHFPQISIMQASIESGTCRTVLGIPMQWIIDYTAADQFTRTVSRSDIGATHGQIFFGSALLAALGSANLTPSKSLRKWWVANWHRASMYRRSHARNGEIVDAISRGRLRTLPLYLASLPPWWRLKNLIRRN